MLRVYQFGLCVLCLVMVVASSWALDVGDVVSNLTVSKAPDGQPIKLSDFYGSSNLILNASGDAGFTSKLGKEAEAFQTKYDAVIVAVQPDSHISAQMVVIADKSGHIRWKFEGKTGSKLAIATLASELAKLKRSKPLPVGSLAPDFSLTETDGETVFTLSNYKGKKNVLVTLLLQTY